MPLMRSQLLLIITFLLVALSSCRSDLDFTSQSGGLSFSRDTVYLDTVFSNIGSSTYTLKVYNNSDNNISIPTVQLGRGLDSRYRIMVDGMTGENGRIFRNVEMLAKDSMYIFIETTANIADANPDDFLYTDAIQFGSEGNFQNVELVTLIKDAVFLYPQRFDNGTTEGIPIEGSDDEIYGFFLDADDHDNEFHFTATKPYVIYGFAAVPMGRTLSIDPGARVHFHDASGILVLNGGRIEVNGEASTNQETLENEVIFEGDRLEPGYDDVTGQWGWIWLSSGSSGSFDYATIKNGTLGLYIQNNSGIVTIKNTQIYNSSNYGILAQTANLTAEKLVINNAGQVALACTLGGSYRFTQSTFNNNWQNSRQYAVMLNNYFVDQESNQEFNYALQEATFTNCIIYGSNQIELLLDKSANNTFNYAFNKCLIKFNTSNQEVLTSDLYSFLTNEQQIKRNEFPDFEDVSRNKLRIGLESAAIGFGQNTSVTHDLLGIPYNSANPDLGAYNASSLEE